MPGQSAEEVAAAAQHALAEARVRRQQLGQLLGQRIGAVVCSAGIAHKEASMQHTDVDFFEKLTTLVVSKAIQLERGQQASISVKRLAQSWHRVPHISPLVMRTRYLLQPATYGRLTDATIRIQGEGALADGERNLGIAHIALTMMVYPEATDSILGNRHVHSFVEALSAMERHQGIVVPRDSKVDG